VVSHWKALSLVQLRHSVTVHKSGSNELVDLCQQTKQVLGGSLCVINNNAAVE
jgi:hypothetical protein